MVFRAPRFDAGGKKTANARFVKVVHNGQVIHENVEVTGPTRAAAFNDEKPHGPLMLQGDHGPVAYRNPWIKPLAEWGGRGVACLHAARVACLHAAQPRVGMKTHMLTRRLRSW